MQLRFPGQTQTVILLLLAVARAKAVTLKQAANLSAGWAKTAIAQWNFNAMVFLQQIIVNVTLTQSLQSPS